jgi:uncharacterized protein
MVLSRIGLFPREERFFDLFERNAHNLVEGAKALLLAFESADALETQRVHLTEVEHWADEVTHQIMAALNRTFVTPIDREDLAQLTGALDDVIDAMEHASAFAALYRFNTLTEPMRQLIRIMVRSTEQLARAVRNLRNFGDPESIKESTVAVHTLENEADAVYRTAIAALFDNGSDVRDLVRQKDMLFALEHGIDRCEDAMDVIRSVVVKNG